MNQGPSLTSEPDPPDVPSLHIQSEHPTPSLRRASPDPALDNFEEEERNGLEIASAALGQPERVGEVPFYAGERTGPTSALDVCSSDQSLPRHFLIPLQRTQLSDEDQEFLHKKGVFTLPGGTACDSLIEAYLLHVHPVLPVIEADVLLRHHQAGQLAVYNLLLLWSIFFVAVNIKKGDEICVLLPSQGKKLSSAHRDLLEFSTNFESSYFLEQCIFDNGNERNKIVLLQSSLLLGFWHSDRDEHAQPWYWIGIAISLCQILGLHRDPDISKYNPSITTRQRSFWRRLWWSCFFRDRWLGLTLGRPLRINLEDCDIPMPLVTDMLFDIDSPRELSLTTHLPSDMPRLADYWVMLIELSRKLGNILATNYRTARPRPSLDETEALEKQLLQSRLPDQYEGGLTSIARFYSNHVHLHYQAMLIIFYRPWGTEFPDGLHPDARHDWQHRMRLRTEAAASRTNEIVDALVQDNLLGFAGPMTPPLLVPAMQTHLLQCKSCDPLTKRIRLNKLEMYMLVMEELQKTYTVASIYRGIFTTAIQQIFPGYSSPVAPYSSPVNAATDPETENQAQGSLTEAENPRDNGQFHDTLTGVADEGDLMQALMDESSIFGFWETWNQI
ncbi:fungal-specific transcription factor domain-containing protein [Penicillium lagena]|uniref:fungal-specific transcription factor domain-containing protein n=1 Tax=Penicillium lagena TaxID=94218 RepID=UPI0025425A12|nr:fungal-specific transcription factor domain-containing protein [Penicillium lagena]KAJ5619291.1 fungal-specific transcription factor domain-containing protein [Penicillium lagena]